MIAEPRKSLTLMELIVATMIFALAVAGLTNIFIAGKRYILHSRSRMSGGELGKVFLDPMQMDVNQSTWGSGTNSLTAGKYYCDDTAHAGMTRLPSCPSSPSANQRTLDGVPFNAEYTVQDMSGETNSPELRRVIMTVNWKENSS